MESGLEPAKHETRDVTPRFIWRGASLVVGTVVVLSLAILWMFPTALQDQHLRLPLPQYPQPRLQENPARDLRAFTRDQRARLEHPETAEQTDAGSRIPIEEAMRQIAEEKIAGWPAGLAETATPSARQSAPESKHAATDHAPNPSQPSISARRSNMRHGVGANESRRLVPSKARKPIATRHHAP